MPKNAQFYLLSDASSAQTNLSAVESLACNLAASAWRLGKRVLLACENEAQALNIDEGLWQREPDEFVPHNLSGEATTYATPIEISWTGKRNAQSRDLLINLQPQLPEFINSFNQIIDFVLAEEQQKALARERYKQLRQLGWELSTEQAG
ncbi:DNA polymerase III subunit chi [Aggregatibacter actinomycetemcomitans]|uniref:DNA polymerase III subunit chi n=1 Tax=Aggregatibacter actinomycetemcomitans TaxID=714 RepID=UPI0011D62945|nr:DNA polymerase III subunit chi [Aggregatibacter actinomycetemcomitans]QEH45271.1 DNA polymerase III subunit chi [Aggregatibacter actinomycetemcomitans]QEH49807.1 DNA polymerase III subunit chi [Aggregatibacter actinomycetemcomitans]TYA50998.1 DNA polymerase III subunit chi [Aggregatibacter actinomycetemcomitans]TYB29027.1 DNA polymerase III subunit chi [Aggregatibacter actinomycetemcomitans]